MVSSFFILLVSGIILLLPLVFWMYIFTTFFPYSISRLQFLGGVVVGGISSIPLVWNESFFLGSILENIFFALSSGGFLGIVQNFLLLFLCIFGFYFVVGYFFQDSQKRFSSVFLFSLGMITVLLIGGSASMIALQNIFPELSSGAGVGYATLSFVSIGGILSYYLVISLLEEGNKYISSLSFSGKGDYFQVAQKYLSLTACVALGFAFFENILYSYFYIQESGIQSSLMSLVFFRSIFTVILHLMSSILFALGFWYVIQKSHLGFGKKGFYFFIFASLGILSHVLFDSALSFGYVALLIFYIFLMYLLMSYLMVQVDQGPESTVSL